MYRQSVLSCGLALFTLAMTQGCVAYTADDADLTTVAAEVRDRIGGPLFYEQAVALAFAQNPELRALLARARAAGADLAPFELQSEYRSDTEMLAVMIDPIALLGLGPRGAANDAIDAEAAAAAVELVTARWRTAAELAEVFVTAAVLADLPVPAIAVDPDAYERAGLAAPIDAARVRAASAEAEAERATLYAESERNLARLRRLLGLPARTPVQIAVAPFGRPPVLTDEAILARPDLTLAAARFRVADAEFRVAVREQYPALMLGPEIPITGGPLQWMGILRLPLGAHGRARAAEHRREAARAELEAAFLEATREVHDAELALANATANADAARAALDASARTLQAALIAVEVDVDAFDRVAEAAGMAVRDARMRREAELEQRLASLELDVAHGWPAVVQPAPASEGGSKP